MFKFAGDTATDRMHRICVEVWETGEWPGDWTESIFIPIPKTGDMKLQDHSTDFTREGNNAKDHTGKDKKTYRIGIGGCTGRF